jgi:hypothetical protein
MSAAKAFRRTLLGVHVVEFGGWARPAGRQGTSGPGGDGDAGNAWIGAISSASTPAAAVAPRRSVRRSIWKQCAPGCRTRLLAQPAHPAEDRFLSLPARSRRPDFVLATPTPSSHNASMEEAHVFTIDIAQDARQLGRYRWSVSENMKVRDTSFYSFTTRREAQADADKFVEKLKAIWQPH